MENDLWMWIFGDAPKLLEPLEGKPWAGIYLFPKVFESIMRGLAQVCFANNPWSGVLVLIGLVVADPLVGLGSLVASFSGLIISLIFKLPDDLLLPGLPLFSPVLVGSVTVSLFPVFFQGPLGYPVWLGIMVMGAFSVCLFLGLKAQLTPVNLPTYTLPFNITTALLFLSFHATGYSLPEEDGSANATEIEENIDFFKVLEGTLKTAGQVYAVENNLSSILILLAIMINSPFVTVMQFIGGFLSSLTGLAVTSPPYSAVYAGVWGYNGFLAAGCIAFFVYPNYTSVFIAFLNSVFVGFMQGGLVPIFQANNLPVFTFPFVLSSFMFLALIENVPGVERVKNLSFPEEHIRLKKEEEAEEQQKEQQTENMPMDASCEEMEAMGVTCPSLEPSAPPMTSMEPNNKEKIDLNNYYSFPHSQFGSGFGNSEYQRDRINSSFTWNQLNHPIDHYRNYIATNEPSVIQYPYAVRAVDNHGPFNYQVNAASSNNFVRGRRKYGVGEFKVARKLVDLHIDGCDLSVTNFIIESYLKRELNITPFFVTELYSHNPYIKSFKLTVNVYDYEKLMKEDSWPEGVLCRKIINKKFN